MENTNINNPLIPPSAQMETISITNMNESIEERLFRAINEEDDLHIKEILKGVNINNPSSILPIWTYKDKSNTILHKLAFVTVTHDERNSVFIKEAIKLIFEYLDNTLVKSNTNEMTEFINQPNDNGYTAYLYASFRGNIYLMHVLETYGADTLKTNNKKLTAMHLAAQGNSTSSIAYLHFKYDNLISQVDQGGSTPLHWACYSGSEIAVDYLLHFSPPELIDQTDNNNVTPLYLAVLSGKTRIVRKLLQKGADKEKGKSPLQKAREFKNTEMIRILSEKKLCCKMCVIKAPVQKIEKSYTYIIFFILFNIVSLANSIIVAYPIVKDDTAYKIVYILFNVFIFLTILIYIILLCTNSLLKSTQTNESPKDYFTKLIDTIIKEQKNIKFNKICPICLIRKEYETKHCFICNSCIKEFDHHCYWINKCVGSKNYCTFFVFLNVITIYVGLVCALNIICWFHLDKIRDKQILITVLKYCLLGANTLLGVFVIPLLLLCGLQYRNYIHNKKVEKNDKNKSTYNTDYSKFIRPLS